MMMKAHTALHQTQHTPIQDLLETRRRMTAVLAAGPLRERRAVQ
jgi:hypothetical protein